MDLPEYRKLEPTSIRSHPLLSEKWVQQRIADDPSILGLGDLILRDRERAQPHAGRLDLLLQDADSGRRYEVEIQLGRTDESHIVRTIEYWDLERRRYPQYDHTGVIVAEDITSRFLNVVSLFNGFIPLVALQMTAFAWEDQVTLVFTRVLDQMTLGLEEEDEEAEAADRSYWERHGSPQTVAMADKLLDLIHTFAPQYDLKYNKFYVGLAVDGQANNFVLFKPQKSILRMEPRLAKSDEIEKRLEEAGLDCMDYSKWGRYRIRLAKGDIEQHSDLLVELMEQAYVQTTE